MEKFCKCCSSPLKDDDIFCERCGTKVSDTNTIPEVPKKRCIACGAELKAGNVFCGKCGKNQNAPVQEKDELTGNLRAILCPTCGNELSPNHRFCTHCGEKNVSNNPLERSTERKNHQSVGVEFNGEGEFCWKGGSNGAETEKYTPNAYKTSAPEQPNKKKKNRKSWVWIAITVAVCIIAIVAILLWKNRTNISAKTNAPASSNENAESISDTERQLAADEDKTDPIVDYSLYDMKIEEYQRALSMGEDSFYKQYTDDSSVNTLMIGYAYSFGIPIAYTRYDVNKNGVEELIFSDKNNIIDIYSINKGKLIKLFPDCYFGDRSRLHVLENGMLLSEGSSGAASSSCELYRISDTTGEVGDPIEAYYYEGDGPSQYMSGQYLNVNEYSDKLSGLLNTSIFDTFRWTVIESSSGQNNAIENNNSESTVNGKKKIWDGDDLISNDIISKFNSEVDVVISDIDNLEDNLYQITEESLDGDGPAYAYYVGYWVYGKTIDKWTDKMRRQFNAVKANYYGDDDREKFAEYYYFYYYDKNLVTHKENYGLTEEDIQFYEQKMHEAKLFITDCHNIIRGKNDFEGDAIQPDDQTPKEDTWARMFYEMYGELMNPFYGIWVGASKNQSDAEKFVEDLNKNNIDGEVYFTSNWSNLNPEPWFVVTAGRYQTEQEAKTALPYVIQAFPGAYVKYSGEYIGPVE